MTIEETLTAPETELAEGMIEPYSAAWWHSRSAEELRDFLRLGFGSAAYEGATIEAERRAREQTRAEDRAADLEAAHKKSLRRQILEGLLLACLLALLVITLAR